MTKLTKGIGFVSIAALAVTAFAAQAQMRQFVVDGNVVSTDVLQTNGKYWVPVDDVAKQFGYFLTINSSQAVLTKIPSPPAQNVGNNQNVSGSGNGAAQSGGGSGMNGGSTGSAAQQFPAVTGSQNVGSGDSNPPSRATQIMVAIGASASVNGFDYRVTGIRDVGSEYKESYDQRASTLHSKYKSDSLVIVDVEETNQTSKPVQAIIPGAQDITVFDGKKVGYPASYLDARQSAEVVNPTDTLGLTMLQNTGLADLMLAPGGTLKFAAIASVPKGDQINTVVMNVSGGSGPDNAGGPSRATVTVTR